MKIKYVGYYEGYKYWENKRKAAIFVNTKERAIRLTMDLIAHDEDWENYTHLIHVFNGIITDVKELDSNCSYNGKCLISDEIMEEHDFLIHYCNNNPTNY